MAHDQNKSAIKGLKRKNIIRKLLNSKKKKNRVTHTERISWRDGDSVDYTTSAFLWDDNSISQS